MAACGETLVPARLVAAGRATQPLGTDPSDDGESDQAVGNRMCAPAHEAATCGATVRGSSVQRRFTHDAGSRPRGTEIVGLRRGTWQQINLSSPETGGKCEYSNEHDGCSKDRSACAHAPRALDVVLAHDE